MGRDQKATQSAQWPWLLHVSCGLPWQGEKWWQNSRCSKFSSIFSSHYRAIGSTASNCKHSTHYHPKDCNFWGQKWFRTKEDWQTPTLRLNTLCFESYKLTRSICATLEWPVDMENIPFSIQTYVASYVYKNIWYLNISEYIIYVLDCCNNFVLQPIFGVKNPCINFPKSPQMMSCRLLPCFELSLAGKSHPILK